MRLNGTALRLTLLSTAFYSHRSRRLERGGCERAFLPHFVLANF